MCTTWIIVNKYFKRILEEFLLRLVSVLANNFQMVIEKLPMYINTRLLFCVLNI